MLGLVVGLQVVFLLRVRRRVTRRPNPPPLNCDAVLRNLGRTILTGRTNLRAHELGVIRRVGVVRAAGGGNDDVALDVHEADVRHR